MMNVQEVVNFSNIKWITFQLSRFRPNRSSGSFFNYQMGNFSIDKNSGGRILSDFVCNRGFLEPFFNRLGNFVYS